MNAMNQQKGSAEVLQNGGSSSIMNNNNNNSIPSMIRQKLKSNQKIDISQIKQYYDISSQNIQYQYAPSNPIGPKQSNNQAQKPEYIESNSFSSPVKTEFSETPQIMQKSKRVAFNDTQISQIIPIDQQQINYLKKNFINQQSESTNNVNIGTIDQNFDQNIAIFEDDPIQIECISQSVTPVKINRNGKSSTISHANRKNDNNEEDFSYRKTGNGVATRMSTNQSLCDEQILQEIRNWENIFEVDKNLLGQVETTFKDMEDRISNLEAQFEICYHLTGKMEQKYQDLHKLLKGTQVYKVSRRNKKKANLRIFFYSPSLEAFCWKAPKDHFPEKKQLVYLKNIREVRTRLEPTRKLPSNFSEQQYLRIIMIDKNQEDLELICEDVSLRAVLLKVINSLIEDIRKSRHLTQGLAGQIGEGTDQDAPSLLSVGGGSVNCEFLVTKYQTDIQNIKDQMMSTKTFFGDSTQLLRKAFFEATQSLVQQERKKRKLIVQQQKQDKLIQKKKEDEEKEAESKAKQNQIEQKYEIQIRKEDYDNLAYQNQELKQEISDLQYQNQDMLERISLGEQRVQQEQQSIQELLNSVSEQINKLCQVPVVQEIQHQFNQVHFQTKQKWQINSHHSSEYIQQRQQYYNEQEQQSQQQYYQQREEIMQILSQCVDKIVYEYQTLGENGSGYERNTASTAVDKANSSQKDYLSMCRALFDKDEEIKKIKYQLHELNNKHSNIIEEYNYIIHEKNQLLDKQSELESECKYAQMENIDVKQDNLTLKSQIEHLIHQISTNEDNFTCIVEGLQLMRDQILDQVDILQEQLRQQLSSIELLEQQYKLSEQQNRQLEQQSKQSHTGMLKLNFLENKLKDKENQIKSLVEVIDKHQSSLSESQSELVCKESIIESLKVTNQQLEQNKLNNQQVELLKISKQQLIQEVSTLKCQIQSVNNKNQYLEQIVLTLQEKEKQEDRQHSLRPFQNKENMHPNVLSSELSFKVRHDRQPSQNSLQFQSKQFNLLNQRNSDLQQQLDASSALVKQLECKIIQRDSYQITENKPLDDLSSRIITNPDKSYSSSNLQNSNKNQYDYSSLKSFHQPKQHNQQTSGLNPNNYLNFATSPSRTIKKN